MRAALIVVDVQNDFKMDAGYYACPMLNEELLSQIESLVSFCRFKKVPIIFTQHSIKTDKSNAEIGEPDEVRACIIGTDGWRVAKEIGPQEDDLYLMKDKYDAFYHSGLENVLAHLSVDTVIICGVCTNNCVRATAEGAYYRNYKLILISDCCGAVDFVERKYHGRVSLYTLDDLKERTYLTRLFTLQEFKNDFEGL